LSQIGHLTCDKNLHPMSSPYLLSDMLHHSGHSPVQRTDNVSEGYSPEATGSSGVDRRWGVSYFNTN
jgi:hypothetical protein